MNWSDVELKVRDVAALFDIEQAKLLFETAQGLPDGAQILEIGAWKGYTTSVLAFACVGTNKRVWTIDTFIGNPLYTCVQDGQFSYLEFWNNILCLGLTQYIVPLVGRSEYFYKIWDTPLDLLFIDGDHSLMVKDYDAFYPHLKTGGWLFIHDVYAQGTEPFAVGMKLLYNMGYRRKGA